jgi:hypothetical protein
VKYRFSQVLCEDCVAFPRLKRRIAFPDDGAEFPRDCITAADFIS